MKNTPELQLSYNELQNQCNKYQLFSRGWNLDL